MGLFDFGKKKQKFDLPNLGQTPRDFSQVPTNIPNDIPVQLPSFSDNSGQKTLSFEESKAPSIPSFDSSVNLNPPQTLNFESIANELKSISEEMKRDPKNPFEKDEIAKSLNIPSINDEVSKLSHELEGEKDHNIVREELEIESPLFINVSDFAIILEDINETKTEITKAGSSFIRISGLQDDKEKHFAAYNRLLEDVQKKLVYMDKALFED